MSVSGSSTITHHLIEVPMNSIRSKIVQEVADTIEERGGNLTDLTTEELNHLRRRLKPWNDQRIKVI